MKYVALSKEGDIRAAIKLLKERLLEDTTSFTRTLGFPSGEIRAAIHWRPNEEMWVHIRRNRESRVYWCCYGVADPKDKPKLDLTAEINIPVSGCNRRVAGAFLRDSDGVIYLAHSGKIGGGKENVGKNAFLDFLTAVQICQAKWPDGKVTEMLIVGSLADTRFPQEVADFVQQRDAFNGTIGNRPPSAQRPVPKQKYSAEFEGLRKGYRVGTTIEGRCDHGIVVRNLRREIQKHGVNAFNSRYQDLFTTRGKSGIRTLYEVKTNCDLASVYSGIGQLLYNSRARSANRARLVLVLPERVSSALAKTIAEIGIEILSYSWRDGRPRFAGMDGLARSGAL